MIGQIFVKKNPKIANSAHGQVQKLRAECDLHTTVVKSPGHATVWRSVWHPVWSVWDSVWDLFRPNWEVQKRDEAVVFFFFVLRVWGLGSKRRPSNCACHEAMVAQLRKKEVRAMN